MTNSVTPFQFALAEQLVEMRVVTREGEPLFVTQDVATILGFRDSHDLNRLLDEDEKADPHIVRVSSATGVVQGRSFDLITESGLYHAVFVSRKPEAKAFRKWVTSEVLPSIRKTGSYNADRWHSLEQIAQDASNASEIHADFWTERVRLALELPAFKDVLVRVGSFTAVQEHAVPFVLPFVLGGRTVKGLPDDYWSRMLDDLRSAKALTKDEFLRNAALMPKVRRALKEIGWTGNAWNLAEMLYLQDLLEVED